MIKLHDLTPSQAIRLEEGVFKALWPSHPEGSGRGWMFSMATMITCAMELARQKGIVWSIEPVPDGGWRFGWGAYPWTESDEANFPVNITAGIAEILNIEWREEGPGSKDCGYGEQVDEMNVHRRVEYLERQVWKLTGDAKQLRECTRQTTGDPK